MKKNVIPTAYRAVLKILSKYTHQTGDWAAKRFSEGLVRFSS